MCLHLSMACWASLLIQTVKNLPAMRETWVQFLGREDPLEEGVATHCRILAWRIPGTEEAGGLHGVPESDTTQRLSTSLATPSDLQLH